MIIHTRQRAILFPLILYTILGLVTSYFVFHATHGDRSLAAKEKLKNDLSALTLTLNALKNKRAEWERKVAMLDIKHIDSDLLEEQARNTLGFIHKDDVVVMLDSNEVKEGIKN